MNTKEYFDFYKILEEFEVVFHPHERMSWGRNRKMYDGVFDEDYNHRSILSNEVVFDFDSESKKENTTNSNLVSEKFKELGINHSLWSTGNKGYHIHTLWYDLNKFSNTTILKKIILKHFADNMKIDYQLAGKHLIRAEGGLNEKNLVTSRSKKLIIESGGLLFNRIPEEIIAKYQQKLLDDSVRKIVKSNDSEVEDKKLKDVLSGEIKINDGREKIMFFAIHQLKKNHEPDEVLSILSSWYRYSGGSKLSTSDIKKKIIYHWDKSYSFSGTYLDDFIPKDE